MSWILTTSLTRIILNLYAEYSQENMAAKEEMLTTNRWLTGFGRLSFFRTIETRRNRRSTRGWVLKPSLGNITQFFENFNCPIVIRNAVRDRHKHVYCWKCTLKWHFLGQNVKFLAFLACQQVGLQNVV